MISIFISLNVLQGCVGHKPWPGLCNPFNKLSVDDFQLLADTLFVDMLKHLGGEFG